jgi:hypothetical protein
MNGDAVKTKRFLIVSNVVIALMCIASVLGYLLIPVARVGVRLKIDRSFLEYVRSEAVHSEGEAENDGLARGIDSGLIIDALIDGLGNDSVAVFAAVRVTPAMLLSSIPLSHDKATSGFLRANVDYAVDSAYDQLEESRPVVVNMVKSVLKAVSGVAIKNGFDEYKDIVSDSTGETDLSKYDDFCQRVGLTEGDIGEDVGEIIEDLSDEGLTPDEIAERARAIYVSIYERSVRDPEYGSDILDKYEYDPDGFFDGIMEFVSQSGMLDAGGKLSIDSVIDALLVGNFLDMIPDADAAADIVPGDDVVNFGISKGARTGSAGSTSGTPASDGSAPAADSASATDNEAAASIPAGNVKDRLKSYLNGLVQKESYGVAGVAVHVVLIVMAAVLLINILSWIYLLIKIAAKASKPNPGVTLWVPIVFGWSLVSFLTFIPYIRLGGLSKLVMRLAGDQAAAAAIPEIGLSYATGGIIAAVCGLALFIFGFIYRRYRIKMEEYVNNENRGENTI